MADEPNTAPAPETSTAEPAADATQAAPASDSAREETEARPSWWARLVRHGTREADPSSSGQGTEPEAANGTSARSVTQQELDRLVQAESDRRDNKRREAAQAEERRRLRDQDPYAYAAQERQQEQLAAQRAESEQAMNQFMANIGTHHDRVAIDPVVMSLDETERDRIMKLEGAGVGLDGRRMVVEESLKALERKWKKQGADEAEARLRRNSTFRKQVYAEHRGREPEPDLLPAAQGRGTDEESVPGILRRFYGIRGE